MARYADKQNLLQLVGKAHDTYAPKESPALTGEPESTTPPVDSRDERIATTRYVRGALATNADCTAESDGSDAGPIVELTAKGHAEQFATTGKNLLSLGNIGSEVSIVGDRVTNTVADTGRHFFKALLMYYNGNTYTSTYSTYDVNSVGKSTWRFTVPSDITFTHALFKHNGANRDIRIGFVYGLTAGSTYTLSMDVIGYDAGTVGGLVLENIQVELGSTATSYEPYTGGAPSPSPDYPQEIQVARGRNLLPPKPVGNYTIAPDGSHVDGNDRFCSDFIPCHPSATYSVSSSFKHVFVSIAWYDKNKTYIDRKYGNYVGNTTFTVSSNAAYITYSCQSYEPSITASSDFTELGVQLSRGSASLPYVPYGNYVGLDVYDGSTHVSTTPIPLPSRGWVAGLPDGTADTLTLDGAGKVVWEKATNEVVLDGSSDENISAYGKYPDDGDVAGFIFNDVVPLIRGTGVVSGYCSAYPVVTTGGVIADTCKINANNQRLYFYGIQRRTEATTVADFKTWLSTHPVTVLYPLATPVTEQRGYVDLPEIPEGATLSIPELDALGVKYVVSVATLISGHESRIAALEAAIAEIVAGS